MCHNFEEVVLWITSSLSERMHLHVFGLFLKRRGGGRSAVTQEPLVAAAAE